MPPALNWRRLKKNWNSKIEQTGQGVKLFHSPIYGEGRVNSICFSWKERRTLEWGVISVSAAVKGELTKQCVNEGNRPEKRRTGGISWFEVTWTTILVCYIIPNAPVKSTDCVCASKHNLASFCSLVTVWFLTIWLVYLGVPFCFTKTRCLHCFYSKNCLYF